MPPTRRRLPDDGRPRPGRLGQGGAPWPKGSIPTAAKAAKPAEIALVVPAGRRRPSRRSRAGTGSPIDAFIDGRHRRARPGPVAQGRPADPDPPRHVRPDRPAADARGGRRLPRRCPTRPRGVRRGRRPTARLAPLRRALGAALARRGPLRRHQGIRLHRGDEVSLFLHLSRLGRRGVQRGHALRHSSSSTSSPPTGCPPRATTATSRRWASSRSAGGSSRTRTRSSTTGSTS